MANYTPSDPFGYSGLAGPGTDSSGHQRTAFTDPNPLTGYAANQVGFDPSHPIQSTRDLLGLGVSMPGAVTDLQGQSMGNQRHAQEFQSLQQQALQRLLSTRAQQTQLAGNLYGTIMGQTPSVANAQLMAGLSRIQDQQRSMAAGASGQNAAAARAKAARNIGNAGVDASGQAAMARAQEVANAQNALANLYAGENTTDVGAANSAGNTGVGLANVGEHAASSYGQLESDTNKANAQADKDVAEKGGQALSMLF